MQPLEREDSEAILKARKLISEGRTLLVAVDSNAFFEGAGDQRRVSFNREWMGKFRRLATQGERLLLSTVWDVEIRRHFGNSIDSQVQVKLPNFAKVGSNKEAVKELNARAKALSLDAQKLVEIEWDSVKVSFNTELIEVPNDPSLAKTIFQLWSNSSWPFEKRKEKRDEFQDAFALTSLLSYVERLRSNSQTADATILVVTADHGCRQFCAQTAALLPCSNINLAIDFLVQREEIIRLASRSRDISKMLADHDHPLFHQLSESLRQIEMRFPPPCFSFVLNGAESSGWLRSLSVDSTTLLMAGPRGAEVEVIEERSDSLQIRGIIRFELTLSLNAPKYAEGTACPSSEVVVSDRKFTLDADFTAGSQNGHWFGGLPTLCEPLRAVVL